MRWILEFFAVVGFGAVAVNRVVHLLRNVLRLHNEWVERPRVAAGLGTVCTGTTNTQNGVLPTDGETRTD